MRKLEIVLIGIITVLSVAVLTQYTNGRNTGDLSQAAVQESQPIQGADISGGQADSQVQTNVTQPSMQDSTLTNLFKQSEDSVVQITSKVSTTDSSIIINGQPMSSQYS